MCKCATQTCISFMRIGMGRLKCILHVNTKFAQNNSVVECFTNRNIIACGNISKWRWRLMMPLPFVEFQCSYQKCTRKRIKTLNWFDATCTHKINETILMISTEWMQLSCSIIFWQTNLLSFYFNCEASIIFACLDSPAPFCDNRNFKLSQLFGW